MTMIVLKCVTVGWAREIAVLSYLLIIDVRFTFFALRLTIGHVDTQRL